MQPPPWSTPVRTPAGHQDGAGHRKALLGAEGNEKAPGWLGPGHEKLTVRFAPERATELGTCTGRPGWQLRIS
ncbi:MAG: hypothetical protein DWH88_04015 [Planctomycetota bacterium]|nr:MAG: hypothetical protein DWH88_04015 [Planctomycetota bacterium]